MMNQASVHNTALHAHPDGIVTYQPHGPGVTIAKPKTPPKTLLYAPSHSPIVSSYPDNAIFVSSPSARPPTPVYHHVVGQERSEPIMESSLLIAAASPTSPEPNAYAVETHIGSHQKTMTQASDIPLQHYDRMQQALTKREDIFFVDDNYPILYANGQLVNKYKYRSNPLCGLFSRKAPQ